MKSTALIPWKWWRRAVQLALLVAFFWLFRRTEYPNADQLPGGENLFFRIDPLTGLSAMLAGRHVIALAWPALVTVGLTLVLGRFFCGWICPLGTLLDYFHRIIRPITRHTNSLVQRHAPWIQRVRHARYFILVIVLVAAVFSVQLVGYVDPFALLVRAMTYWADPHLFQGADVAMSKWASPAVKQYAVKHLLPFRQMVYHTAIASAAILAVIFALELVARRFWCRYLCPLGAGLGLLARPSLVKRLPVRVCKNCGSCATDCRMGALSPHAGFSPEGCNLCMVCVDDCPNDIVRFSLKSRKVPPAPVDLSRRGILTAVAAGAVAPLALKAAAGSRPDALLLRPPGAEDETRFLSLCVRCGECMKVCATNVLQPAILQAGLQGMFSPRLVPRLIFEQSYCEYACTLCGQVCPTGAIRRLLEEAKHKHPTGKAYFDHNRCLPWAKQTSCIRCEEMCPAPAKAIQVRNIFKVKGENGEEIEIQQPFVERELCVGCGICESNCPIEGAAGIRVRRTDAADPGTEFKDQPGATTRTA